jgi:hypothetical protein
LFSHYIVGKVSSNKKYYVSINLYAHKLSIMNEIIESISKLIPFEKMGLKKEIAEPLSIVVLSILGLACGFLVKIIRKRRHDYKVTIEDLKPQFDYLAIKEARQYYIQTHYQNASPTREEEPGFTHQYIARNKLIPFFIFNAFYQRTDSNRFYLILADSGMGKTTFMINLFFAYNSFWNRRRECKMKLLRFSDPTTIKQIQEFKIDEAKKTILLLDALDEDVGIMSKNPQIPDSIAFRNRVDEIIELTRCFSEVVITCRSQYFPGQEEDPYELKIKRPDENGFYILNKIYISPFNDKEVSNYLNKKYGRIPFLKQKNKKAALEIISKSKNLVMRPMLLSYIDYLIKNERSYTNTYEIYDALVSEWLIRESKKRKEQGFREDFIRNLLLLSSHLAKTIYTNWKTESRMCVSKDEALAIANKYHIQLVPEEITGQSLLTCDGLGNWKFAHKSIMEFFLAQEAYRTPIFFKDFSFIGMDMAEKFYEEQPDPLIYIQNESLNSLEKINNGIDDSSSFYVFTKLVNSFDHRFLVTSERTQLYGQNMRDKKKSHLATLQEAIDYCNKFNEKMGYPPVYTQVNNSIKFNFEKANELKLIRGFRLPTVSELKYLYLKKINAIENLPINSENLKLKSLKFEFDVNGELCFGDNFGEEAFKVLPIVQPLSRIEVKEEILSRGKNEGKFSFRLVFNP